jgi:hypothetical protein
MSSRLWKRTRRADRLRARALDRRKRQGMRVPWWVYMIEYLIVPGYRATWVAGWEREHERKMHKAVKATAHFRRRVTG